MFSFFMKLLLFLVDKNCTIKIVHIECSQIFIFEPKNEQIVAWKLEMPTLHSLSCYDWRKKRHYLEFWNVRWWHVSWHFVFAQIVLDWCENSTHIAQQTKRKYNYVFIILSAVLKVQKKRKKMVRQLWIIDCNRIVWHTKLFVTLRSRTKLISIEINWAAKILLSQTVWHK